MKLSPRFFGIVSILLQLGVACALIWSGNFDSSPELLPVPAGPTAELISQYQGLLRMAKSILTGSGIVLLCSAALGAMSTFNRN
jgi:hypothetical protein